jgi:hypothetical protein
MFSIYGMSIQVSPDVPKYELPEELLPGVPWPESFREYINEWSRDFIGTTNLLRDGEVLKTMNALHVNPRTYTQMRDHFKESTL